MRSAAAVVAAIALAGCAAAASPGSQSQAGGGRPGVSEQRLLALALAAARGAGDRHPVLVQHAEGTRAQANLVDSGAGVPGNRPSYLVAIRGHFVLRDVSTPMGAPAPRGTVLTLVVDAATGRVTDGGASGRYPDLARLGRVVTDLRRRAPA